MIIVILYIIDAEMVHFAFFSIEHSTAFANWVGGRGRNFDHSSVADKS